MRRRSGRSDFSVTTHNNYEWLAGDMMSTQPLTHGTVPQRLAHTRELMRREVLGEQITAGQLTKYLAHDNAYI